MPASTIRAMYWLLITIGVRFLETLFIVGMLGSLVVILWSGVEDVQSIFEPDEPLPMAHP